MDKEPDHSDFIGYYSGAWLWPDDQIGWVKTVLPFFDKVSLILPKELFPRVLARDPVLAQPLYDMGLLENREPSDVLGPAASAAIVETILAAVYTDRYRENDMRFADSLVGRVPRAGLTVAHFGPSEDTKRALQVLQERGLASAVGDDGLFQLEAGLQTFVLAVCAQTMCSVDRSRGRDVSPFRPPVDRTTRHDVEYAFTDVLAGDVGAVGADLSNLPLDEVLDIRDNHGPAYRAYLRNVRGFVQAVSDEEDPFELSRGVYSRREEILDAASDLRHQTRVTKLKQTLSVGFGVAGAGWTAHHGGDHLGAVLAAAAAVVGLVPNPEITSAYSYLFRVADYGR